MKVIVVLLLLVSVWKCHTLRCRTEDGPSEEEIKRIIRMCMRKVGDNSDRNNSENNYEDSNSNESYDNGNNNNNYDRGNSNNNNNRGNRFARFADVMVDRWQQQQGYDNSYGNINQKRNGNDYNGNNGFDFGNDYQNTGYSNYGNYNRNYNLTNRNNQNNTEDKSCTLQCFFQEMKMTNNEGFPDKHKVTHIITKDVRDREMKDFLTDSIQECFHIVEMERRREKCTFSKSITTCLSEKAKANCDDYLNETMIF